MSANQSTPFQVRELLERLNDYRSLGDRRSFEKYARTHMKAGRWSEMKGERSLEEEEGRSRRKRGACTGQTGLFGILFGVAYQPNIDCVNQELERFRCDFIGQCEQCWLLIGSIFSGAT